MPAAHLVESIYKQYINQVTGYTLFTTATPDIINSRNESAAHVKGYTEVEIPGQFHGILLPDGQQAQKSRSRS